MRKKLIYIAGTMRSGTTLLCRLLGESNDTIALGEPHNLLRHLNGFNTCSCGEDVEKCRFWSKIFLNQTNKEEFIAVRDELTLNVKGKTALQELLLMIGIDFYTTKKQIELLHRFYSKIYLTTKASVLIDDSKVLQYLYILKELDLFDIYVIHLIRDPRAVAFSWARKKVTQNNQYMMTHSPIISAIKWFRTHLFILISHGFVNSERYIQIRYEDLTANPSDVLKKINQTLGLINPIIFNQKNEFYIQKEDHLLFSNPSTLKMGPNIIKLDAEFRKKGKWWSNTLVTLICWPLMVWFNYPLIKGK